MKKNADLELNNISSSDWYNRVVNELSADEYNITFDSESKAYQSPNRLNNMRFTYSNEGFIASTRNNKVPLFDINYRSITEDKKQYKTIPSWKVRLEVNSFFKGEKSEVKFSGDKFNADKNTAFIEDDNLRINYINNKEGMRQDFIIKKKPDGDDKLVLNIKAETKLKLNLGSDAIVFKDKRGSDQLKYSGLKVWGCKWKNITGLLYG